MQKTTVYLDEDDAEGLRRLAIASGDSQAELIREGVRRILGRKVRREFHSMAKGRGAGNARPRWEEEGLLDKTRGLR